MHASLYCITTATNDIHPIPYMYESGPEHESKISNRSNELCHRKSIHVFVARPVHDESAKTHSHTS